VNFRGARFKGAGTPHPHPFAVGSKDEGRTLSLHRRMTPPARLTVEAVWRAMWCLILRHQRHRSTSLASAAAIADCASSGSMKRSATIAPAASRTAATNSAWSP
jgi:hypothetical protein